MKYIKIERIENEAADFHLLSCMISDGIYPMRIFIDSDESIANPYSKPTISFEYRSDLKVYHKHLQTRAELCVPRPPMSLSEALTHQQITGSLPACAGVPRQFTQPAFDPYTPQEVLLFIQKELSTLRL